MAYTNLLHTFKVCFLSSPMSRSVKDWTMISLEAKVQWVALRLLLGILKKKEHEKKYKKVVFYNRIIQHPYD